MKRVACILDRSSFSHTLPDLHSNPHRHPEKAALSCGGDSLLFPLAMSQNGGIRIPVGNPCLIGRNNMRIQQKINRIPLEISDSLANLRYISARNDAICDTFADHSVPESSLTGIVRRFEADCRPGIPRYQAAAGQCRGSIHQVLGGALMRRLLLLGLLVVGVKE